MDQHCLIWMGPRRCNCDTWGCHQLQLETLLLCRTSPMETCLCLQLPCPAPSTTLAEGVLLLMDPLAQLVSSQGLPTLMQVKWCRDAGKGYPGSQMCPMGSSELKLLGCLPGRGPGSNHGFIASRRGTRSLGREQCVCYSVGALEKVGCMAEDILHAHFRLWLQIISQMKDPCLQPLSFS